MNREIKEAEVKLSVWGNDFGPSFFNYDPFINFSIELDNAYEIIEKQKEKKIERKLKKAK